MGTLASIGASFPVAQSLQGGGDIASAISVKSVDGPYQAARRPSRLSVMVGCGPLDLSINGDDFRLIQMDEPIPKHD
jgi:hypothetical protein